MFESKAPLLGAEENGVEIPIESVAAILDRESKSVIDDWLARVSHEEDLMKTPLGFEDRTGHLPQLLHDVILRLRLNDGHKAILSEAANQHGRLRRRQGYTAAMIVVESRLLQVSLFSILHKNVKSLEFALLLPDIMTIADEVDSQLKAQITSYVAASKLSADQAP